MAEEPVVVAYFKKLFRNPAHSGMGRIEGADVEIKGELCPRRGNKDQVFFYGRLEEGKITAIKYLCALCDPHMFVAADILCKLVVGKTRDEISALDQGEFEELLGGESMEGTEHFRRARELLVLGIIEAEEKA